MKTSKVCSLVLTFVIPFKLSAGNVLYSGLQVIRWHRVIFTFEDVDLQVLLKIYFKQNISQINFSRMSKWLAIRLVSQTVSWMMLCKYPWNILYLKINHCTVQAWISMHTHMCVLLYTIYYYFFYVAISSNIGQSCSYNVLTVMRYIDWADIGLRSNMYHEVGIDCKRYTYDHHQQPCALQQ